MFKFFTALTLVFIFSAAAETSQIDDETKKNPERSYIEDIFIWKISDELKLTAQEEKKFTEINRSLNRKKSDLNKKIHQSVQNLSANSSEGALNKYKKLIQDYNQLSISEFDSIRRLLGTKKFISYLKIKNELTNKIKSILTSEKRPNDKTETLSHPLPPPKVIIEKN